MKTVAIQALLLPVLVWLVWSADLWMAVSLTYPAYLVVVFLGFGLLLLPAVFTRRRAVLIAPGLWLAFLAVLPFVTNSALKPLMWGVRDLEPGMSRAEVVRVLEQSFEDTGYPEPRVHCEDPGDAWGEPSSTRLCFKPRGRDPGLQAESLHVLLVDGRFARATFTPD